MATEAWQLRHSRLSFAFSRPHSCWAIIIDNIYVRDAKVQFGDTLGLPMPDVHLRDVGKRSNGASAGEVVKAVWGSVAGGATNVASRAGGAVKAGAKTVIEGARSLFK
jgi:hypothetical protein